MSERDERERTDQRPDQPDEFENYGSNGGSSQWGQRVLTKEGVRDRTVSRDADPVSGDENPHRK